MQGSTYTCSRWSDLQSQYVATMAMGIQDVCPVGQIKTTDFILTDDVFIGGVEFIAQNNVGGDNLTIRVIDTNGVTGYPPGTVLSTPVSNWNISEIQKMVSYEAIIPQKARAGFTIRIVYTSTGTINDVNFGINFSLLKILM